MDTHPPVFVRVKNTQTNKMQAAAVSSATITVCFMEKARTHRTEK